jgi:hypothetical protein
VNADIKIASTIFLEVRRFVDSKMSKNCSHIFSGLVSNCHKARLMFKALAFRLRIIKVSFIMSYTYNGTEIRVEQPIRSISVNKSKVVFADGTGRKQTQFSSGSEARHFLNWLTRAC